MRRSACRTERAPRGLAVALALALIGGVATPAIGLAAPAPGAAADAREGARRLLVEGAALYEQGEFAAALRKFEAAHAAFPSAKIFFNFGQAYRGLARHVDAIEAFDRFLAEAPEADEELRAAARRYLAELEPTVGALEVSAGTPGAELFVDGRRVGTLPLRRPVRLAPGPHQLSLEKAGHLPRATRVEVAPGSRVRVAGALTPVGRAAPSPAAGRALAAAGPAADAGAPLHRRWWVWTLVGAVAAGSVAAFAVTRRPESFSCGSCERTIPVPP